MMDDGRSPAQKAYGDVAPALADLSDRVLFGEVWERPGLSKRDRSLATVAKRLLLEGGGRTNGLFFQAGLVDEVSLLVAPAIDGGDGVSGAFDAGDALGDRAKLSLAAVKRLDHGLVHLRHRVERD